MNGIRLFVVLFCGLNAGCASVTVKASTPGVAVTVDGKEIGKVSSSGTPVDVPLGFAPVMVTQTEVLDPPADGTQGPAPRQMTVSVPRTRTMWAPTLGVAAGTCLELPMMGALGFCVANPGALVAPLVFAQTGDIGILTVPLTNPTWFTLPVMGVCCAAGLAPLVVAVAAEAPPEDVVLPPIDGSAPVAGAVGF